MNAKASPRCPVLNRGMRVAAAALGVGAGLAQAQVVVVPAAPQIGSSNPVTAAPPVARPHRKPCIVPLFHNLQFADFTPKAFSYAPARRLSRPVGEGGVHRRLHRDRRTAVRPHRGLLSRPRQHLLRHHRRAARRPLSPSWHVERDVTDLTALLRIARRRARPTSATSSASPTASPTTASSTRARALEFYPASGARRAADPGPRGPGQRRGRRCRHARHHRRAPLRRRSTCRATSSAPTWTSSRRASQTMSSGTSACRAIRPRTSRAAATRRSARPRSPSTASRPESRRCIPGSTPAASIRTCGSRFPGCRRSTSAPTVST